MKWSLRYIILLLGILQIACLDSTAQKQNDPEILSSPLYREKFCLFTDRMLYASGEPVLFRVFNQSNSLLKKNSWSKVIYVEVINQNNVPVAQGKYQLNPSGGSGALLIPDSVSSGSYYLRAYSKWMRNYSPSAYFKLPLAIVNPRNINTTDLSPLSAATEPVEEGLGTVSGIICSTDKDSYGKREKVRISFERSTANPSPDGYCMTVIRNGYLDTNFAHIPGDEENDQTGREMVLYYPETKGLSVTGRAVSGSDRKAEAYRSIYLTLLGAAPDCYGLLTDEKGKIHMTIPYHTGARDVLLTYDPDDEKEIEISLDAEFSREYSGIPGSSVDFFRDRRDLVGELTVNRQVKLAFMPVKDDTAFAAVTLSGEAFYGYPDFRYLTRDFISLPNLEEFFYELIPCVQLKNDRGRRYFTILDENGAEMYSPPLILLDHVPVLDIESILTVSPALIEYIDIINTVYIRGSSYYGGIISLRSKNDDHAEVKIPSGSAFFSFSSYTPHQELVFPDYSQPSVNTKIPDLRTTLYWDPHLDLSDEGDNSTEFYTSDIGGEYIILIRGMTEDGRIIRSFHEFVVE